MFDPEKIKPFIVHLTTEEHFQLKEICLFRHVTMRQFVSEAIIEKIREHESRQ